jgi:putative PIN family toxin of toxin-antitoxin system
MTTIAVFDTNVLISSLLTRHEDAATVQVVMKLFTGEIIPLYSEAIMSEYMNVLHRKKFSFSENTIDKLINVIQKYGIKVRPTPSGEMLSDMKDLPFYEVVLEKQDASAYLITGNTKHFPKKPFIVTANEMLEILSLPIV